MNATRISSKNQRRQALEATSGGVSSTIELIDPASDWGKSTRCNTTHTPPLASSAELFPTSRVIDGANRETGTTGLGKMGNLGIGDRRFQIDDL